METGATAPFTAHLRVHFDMLDALGMLHNAAYIVLFERARFDFWTALGLVPGEPGLDWPYYVAHNEIDYRAPILRPQAVRVTVAISRLGRTSVTFAHEIFMEDDTLAAEGATVFVRVDPQTHRPLPWSDGFRSLLASHLRPEAPAE